MTVPTQRRLRPSSRFAVTFLAGVLTALLAVAAVVIWQRMVEPPARSTPAPPPAATSTPSPSIDDHAGDYEHSHEHGHDTAGDEKPGWEPAVLGFGKYFPRPADTNAARWRQRLAPFVAAAVRDELADIDLAKVPRGRYESYELLETGSYQIAAKVTYREGWALVLYVTSDGRSWSVTAYDRFDLTGLDYGQGRLRRHIRHAGSFETSCTCNTVPYAQRMKSPHNRRKRGTPTVQIHMLVEPDVKELIDRYAALSGLPQWAIVEAAIRAGKPDSSGLPAGWELPKPQEEGLPLSA